MAGFGSSMLKKMGWKEDLMRQLHSSDSFPNNHNPNEAANVAPYRHKLAKPINWFKRPVSNPLVAPRYFPEFDKLPLDTDYDEDFYEGNTYRKFWILLAEISDASHAGISFLRNEVKAKDKLGRVFPIFFYPDSDSGQFNYRSLRQGSTLVLFCPVQHQFLDGRIGLRMEQLETVRVLPVTLAHVLRTAALAHACSVYKCWKCQSSGQQQQQQQQQGQQPKQRLLRCTGCGYARYCSRDCQLADFSRHKVECASDGRILRQIVRLVYFRYESTVRQQRRDDLFVTHPFDLFA